MSFDRLFEILRYFPLVFHNSVEGLLASIIHETICRLGKHSRDA
jgi:hypothetical protein